MRMLSEFKLFYEFGQADMGVVDNFKRSNLGSSCTRRQDARTGAQFYGPNSALPAHPQVRIAEEMKTNEEEMEK